MPPTVVGGAAADAEAAWRGAFLARGTLTEPGRSSALELSCPGPEVALAMVGAARRLGVASKAREARGADRVVLRDGDAISALLSVDLDENPGLVLGAVLAGTEPLRDKIAKSVVIKVG